MSARVLRLGRVLERLEDLADVQPDALSLRLDATRELEMIRAVGQSHARRCGELPELALHLLGIVFRGDVGVELLLTLSCLAAGNDLLADRLDALLEDIIGVRAQPGVGQALLERIGAAEVAEYDVELTDHELEELDLLVEKSEHVRFDRAARGEVDDVRLTSLANAVDAADALLHDHRVPGQLVVHEAVAELQVQSFRPGAGRDEHGFWIFLEGGELLGALRHRQCAGVDDRLAAVLPNVSGDELKRRQVLTEDDDALAILREDFAQLLQLGMRVDLSRV